jgi:hypothetical protein
MFVALGFPLARTPLDGYCSFSLKEQSLICVGKERRLHTEVA